MKTADKVAFTLVELMVVIGLMALLGTISVTGYFAAVRGMSDRAAVDDTRSLIRQAQQVCLIDQTPTAVLFYNRQTAAQSDSVSTEDAKATSAGTAVAVKMVGRISYVKNNILVDEFADWNQSYPAVRSAAANDAGIRFYRMTDLKNSISKGIDGVSSIVSTSVEPVDMGNEYMIASGLQLREFCSDFKKKGSENMDFSGTAYENGNNERWGHRIQDQNGIKWKIGDAYGVEIGTLNLPKGYIYGSQPPNSMKIQSIPSLMFAPSDANSNGELPLNQTPTISAWRSTRFRTIGSLSASDLKDETK